MESKPTYGGQAVLEGVMIRGRRAACVAVRRPDGGITVTCLAIGALFGGRLRRAPLVRGVIVLVETLVLGARALTYSANVAAEAEGEEIGKPALAFMMALSLLLAIGLFFLLPLFATRPLESVGGPNVASAAEGLVRLGIFLAYLYLIGRAPGIRRVFMYHGAEHMTVHAQERGSLLTVDQVRRYPAAHPRCGTAFLLVVMVVAIIVFVFAGREPLWWLVTSRIVLVPVIAAASYEVIRFSGRHEGHPLVRLLIAPSLALQALTTRAPQDDQIEVAIAAMNKTMEADADAATVPGA